MKYCILYLITISFFFACNTVEKDSKYFNGDIYIYSDEMQAKKMSCDTIQVEGVYLGPAFICDSLLFYYPMNQTEKSAYEIYNIKDQSFLGSYFYKGGGPEEFSSVTTIFQFYKENGNLKTMLYAMNENKLIDWNISESIHQQKTIIDALVSYDWMTDEHAACYNYLYRMDSNVVFTATQAAPLTMDRTKVSLPLFEKRTIDTNRKLQSYSIFKDTPIGNESNFKSRENFYNSSFAVKPDLTKMVQALVYLPQLNILDLVTGTIKGFRAKGPDFSTFEKTNGRPQPYYMGISATDQFVLALYLVENAEDESKNRTFVHVHDWDGNLIRKIDLDGFYNQMTVDEVNNILYVRSLDSEILYAYNLNDL